jgi:hypothetical protein
MHKFLRTSKSGAKNTGHSKKQEIEAEVEVRRELSLFG